jgi:Uncharacterized conserved protein
MDYDRILQGILDIGEEMVVCGAEVSRVEGSIFRMCESYDMHRVNVFIITSNIQVTLEAPDGRILTQIRCIKRYDVNFDRLDYLNNLSRYVCDKKPDVAELRMKFDEVLNRKKQASYVKFAGAVMVAGGFTVFFGGGVLDVIAASLMGILVVTMEKILISRETNQLVYNFVVSFIGGMLAMFMVRIGLGTNVDRIMMGGIMLLIPGIALTNAVRDMLIGDIASGLLRLVNALLVAASIACGFALALILLGGVL